MTLKSIFFCLFLYVCLVWVGAAYLYTGPKVEEVGLLWTGGGLLAVLLIMVLSRLFGWARILRARAAARPKPAPPSAVPVHEDEVGLKSLLSEANATLAGVYRGGAPQTIPATLATFPIYLLIGPEASGKTSAFLNAGLEPQLLAGDAGAQGPSTATRWCNIWLAQEKIFFELAGQLFDGDLARWQRMLGVLAEKPQLPRWQKLWGEPPRGLTLSGVIAFCEVKEFAPVMSPQAHERLSRQFHDWQERLGIITEVFGLECPVTFVISKCDGLPYFADFFRRLPDSEIGQVLGCAFPPVTPGANALSPEAESKRLTKSFNALFRSLADKRVTYLSHEPEAGRRPSIYEFPRELKRIRPALVQFLTSVFRPHALRPSPQLRGYYLSGIAEREIASPVADTKSHTQWTEPSINLEATMLFRGDATQILRGGGDLSATPKRTSGTTRRWLFLAELFNLFLAAAPGGTKANKLDSRVERNLKLASVAICAACLLFCTSVVTSWTGNLHLLHSLRNTPVVHKDGGPPATAELQSLENLRQQVSRLTLYDHEGAPLSLRWGLYSGNGILEPMRAEYFRRFKQLLLGPLNSAMAAQLSALPVTPGPNAPYSPIFRTLKAHLMITSGECRPEPAFVFGALKDTRDQVMPVQDPAWQALADRQVEFYTSELRFGNPTPLPQDIPARDRARQYLMNIQGVDRLYSSMLSAAEKTFQKPQKLSDLAPNYTQVLNGPNEISKVFTRDGWNYFEKASHSGGATAAEACVGGGGSNFGGDRKHDADTARAIQRLYLRDYVEHWRKYIAAFSVLRYSGAADAAHKLDILSDHKSPLLALLAMTSDQTNFPAVSAEPEGFERVKPVVNKFFPSLGKKAAAANLPGKRSVPEEFLNRPADITKVFQPVHTVVPAGSETWVVDKNAAYVDALAALGHSMRDIARLSDTPDPAVIQAASQNYDKALDAARQIARSFEPMGVGLDVTVERLLEAPIQSTQRLIPTNLDNLTAGKINGQLHAVCERMRPTFHKYPFQPSDTDATLDEVAAAFAPSMGAIWKFQAQYLGDWTLKEGGRWKEKDPAKKPQVTPEMLNFLNRAQTLSDIFYPSGSNQPQLTYTLRPKLDPSFKDDMLELDVDGQQHVWTSSIQKQFSWPAPPGAKEVGVRGIIRTGSISVPFTSRGGTWAIFRVMGDAEPRATSSRIVEWKHIRGGSGRVEEIQPAAVRLEFVEFPGGVDLFNPRFFGDLQCPSRALQ